MRIVDLYLNDDAAKRPSYYRKRGGRPLEKDVYDALCQCSKNTSFEGMIELVSGQRFPDIVVANKFGVEVKSTTEDQWTSTGGSILESTRVNGVDFIFLTFGKLGGEIKFLSRPYRECMSDIVVTHYPRYKIDMEISEGATIFDKIGVSYNNLRKLENPVKPVAQYYKSKLQEGQSFWWVGEYDENNSSPLTVRIWSSLDTEERVYLTVHGYCLFPEVIASQYSRYSLWLVTEKGVINNNVRDSFSAGGKYDFFIPGYGNIKAPASFGRIDKFHERIEKTINDMSSKALRYYWNVESISDNRIEQWISLVVGCTGNLIDSSTANLILKKVFSI